MNLAGVEDGLQFWGGSRLVSPTGDVLAKAKYDEEDFVVCEVDFSDLRTAETFIPTLAGPASRALREVKEAFRADLEPLLCSLHGEGGITGASQACDIK